MQWITCCRKEGPQTARAASEPHRATIVKRAAADCHNKMAGPSSVANVERFAEYSPNVAVPTASAKIGTKSTICTANLSLEKRITPPKALQASVRGNTYMIKVINEIAKMAVAKLWI